MSLSQQQSGCLPVAIEAAAWLSALTLGVLLVVLNVLGIRGASLLCILFIIGLIYAAWRNFDGGRHPCFLFLGMLFVFQCGRLPGFWTGFPDDPFMASGMFPFSVSLPSQEITLLLIAGSALFIYIPSRFTYKPIVFTAGIEQQWLQPLYLLLLLTLPFAAYKNYIYLSFVRSHGGYMAIYTESKALLQSAGILVRSVAIVGTTVLLLLYTFERRKRYLLLLLSLFFAVSTMDLLIGLRGKFFVQILLLWYVHNLKTGKKFNFAPLLSAAAVISLLAALIVGFRTEGELDMVGPLGFLSSQGVSMNVTELAVDNRSLFAPRAGRYLFNEVLDAFSANEASLPGSNFDADLSVFLNPVSAGAGYGTGSSYLAEAYLFGGIAGVMTASFLIGLCLSWLHYWSRTWVGSILLITSLGWIIYMPRMGLISPFSLTVRGLMVVGVAAVLAIPIAAFLRLCSTLSTVDFPANGVLTPYAKGK